MKTMNFNHTFSRISLLTIIFLGGFNNLGSTVVAEVETKYATTKNVLLSAKGQDIAQNEIVATDSLETKIIAQINRARTNPSDYADWLEEQRQYYDGIMLRFPGEKPVRTNRGLQTLSEAIDFVRQQAPLPPLTYSEAMAIAAEEQLASITDNRNQGNSRFQNISYGKVTAEAIVMQLVVDDGFRDRRHRLAIFSNNNQETGVSCREDQLYERICAIAYAENPEETILTEDLIVNENSDANSITETTEVDPELAIAPDEIETTIQETIPTPENPDLEENVSEPEIEAENTTNSALNTQPNNSLLIDKIERGFLEEGDKVIPNDGSFYDSYPLSVKAGESFVISLESADFDTFLAIMDEDGNIIEQNDDVSENDSNSQLQITIPNDGTYNLIVNAYDQGGKGAYILTISR